MRTKNEKMLLGVLIFILVAAGNFYGYKWIAKKQIALDTSYREMYADQMEAKVALQKQEMWEKRLKWIAEHEPPLGEEGEAKAQVLEAVTKGAKDNKLEIMEQSLGDTQTGPGGTRINVTIKVKGSMEALCKWMSELEKPASFYAVVLFSLKADQDQKSMVCSMQVVRYFKGSS